MLFCGPVWVHLDWYSLCFLSLCDFFQVREVFCHYSSNLWCGLRFSILCSLSSPSGSLMMQMLLCLMLSQTFFRLFSFLLMLFSFWCSACMLTVILSSNLQIWSTVSHNFLLIHFIVFFHFRYCILHFWMVLFYGFYFILNTIFKFSLRSSTFSSQVLEHTYNNYLKLCICHWTTASATYTLYDSFINYALSLVSN